MKKAPASEKQKYLCRLLGIKLRSNATRELACKKIDEYASKHTTGKSTILFVHATSTK